MANKLLAGSIKTLLLKMVNIGTMFLVSIILARALGVTEYGSYVFAFTLVSLFSESMFVGLRTIALRNTAIYLEENTLGLLRGLNITLHQFMFVGAGLAATALLATAWYFSEQGNGYNPWVLVVGSALPFVLGLNRIRDGILRGAGSVLASQIPKLVVRPLLLLCSLLAAWYIWGTELDATWAMSVQIIAAAFACILYTYLLHRRLGNKLQASTAQYRRKEWFTSLVPLVISEAFYSLDARLGVLLIGVFLSSADAGVYHASFRLAELIILAHAAAIVVIEPQVAKLYHLRARTELQDKITSTTRLVFLVSLPIAAAMMIWGSWLLTLFGPEFSRAAPALTILAASQVINSAFGYPAMLLIMANKASEVLRIYMLGVSINLGLNILLLPSFGITGSAWAALCSILITQILLMIRAKQLLHLNSSIIGSNQPLPPWAGHKRHSL